MEFSSSFYLKAMPYMAMIFLTFGYAGMFIICKHALNNGMSPHVFAAYRHAIATIFIAPFALIFERKTRPRMTLSIFIKIVFLGLLEPTIDQNLYYLGMKYTTAAFASTMGNTLPAFTFFMAWCLSLEKVNLRRLDGQAKITGTLITIGGAMVMTLVKGAAMPLPWTNNSSSGDYVTSAAKDPIKGALMIITGCFTNAAYFILQAMTLKSYPTGLSLTLLICLMGTIQCSGVALALERKNLSAWSIQMDSKLLAAVYSGVICSGIGYYLESLVIRSKGPVFVSSFKPLIMLIVTILGSFLLSETMYLGGVLGAYLIVFGLYLVLWGKRNDLSPTASDVVDETKSNLSTSVTNQTSAATPIAQLHPAPDNV